MVVKNKRGVKIWTKEDLIKEKKREKFWGVVAYIIVIPIILLIFLACLCFVMKMFSKRQMVHLPQNRQDLETPRVRAAATGHFDTHGDDYSALTIRCRDCFPAGGSFTLVEMSSQRLLNSLWWKCFPSRF
jgi:hypothetical protein